MDKIKKFSIEEISKIRSIFPLVCDQIPYYNGKETCKKCGVHHRRLPDKQTFRMLISIYNATDEAWSKVFNTDRASVTNLRKKYQLSSYDTSKIWNEARYMAETREFFDRQPIYDFFELLSRFPKAKEKDLLKIVQINEDYFNIVIKFNDDINEDYKAIKRNRSRNQDYIFCIRCKIRKRSNNFANIDRGTLSKSKICNICSEENLKNFKDPNSNEKIKCQNCGKRVQKSDIVKSLNPNGETITKCTDPKCIN